MRNIKLSNVRLSFNALFEAEDFDGDKNYAYNAKFIIEKDSAADKLVREAMLEVANDAFSGKGAEVLKKVANDKAQYCYQEYDEDHMVLATKRKDKAGRPLVLDADRTPLAESDGKPYAGCYVNALIRPWAMASKGKHWVRCGLEGVQFVKDGEAFGARASVSDFDDISVDSEAVDDLL